MKGSSIPTKQDQTRPAWCVIQVAEDDTIIIMQLTCGDLMELKTARLTVLVDPAKKKAFEALCARQDVTPSQVVRRLIRDYLAQHGIAFVPSGLEAAEDMASSPP